MYRVGKEKATRVELRSPDPACNPYLAFALMLSAGLRGIEKEYKLPAPIEENIFDMNSEVRKLNNIQALPDTLENAALLFSNSELARETLQDQIGGNPAAPIVMVSVVLNSGVGDDARIEPRIADIGDATDSLATFLAANLYGINPGAMR